MDTLDTFRARFEALEQQTAQMQQHTRTLERRLRWWRGIACSLVLLGLLSLPLRSGTAQTDLDQRVADLEQKLAHVTSTDTDIVFSQVNVHIENGLGSTQPTNGLGNLFVGYNELRNSPNSPDVRTGSHNVVVGTEHNFSSFGGLVVGRFNEISGEFASVSGGGVNTASGLSSSVCAGADNTASGSFAAVSGGSGNTALGGASSISGGVNNTVTASGANASVSGGDQITEETENGWAAGSFGNVISGQFRSP